MLVNRPNKVGRNLDGLLREFLDIPLQVPRRQIERAFLGRVKQQLDADNAVRHPVDGCSPGELIVLLFIIRNEGVDLGGGLAARPVHDGRHLGVLLVGEAEGDAGIRGAKVKGYDELLLWLEGRRPVQRRASEGVGERIHGSGFSLGLVVR